MIPENVKQSCFVSVLIGTRDRPRPLFRCLKSILNQNYSELEILVLDDNSKKHNICSILSKQVKDSRLKCYRSDQQLGVAGGRNFLMKKARGEIFIFIDDDAVFEDNKCITRIVRHFTQNPQVGILAFKVIDHQDNKQADLLVPFSRRWRRKWPELVEKERLVSYYLGTCHALRRKVIEQCGFYQEDLIFGSEELDLSYRVVQNGIDILYCPDIVAHHFPEPSVVGGRNKKGELYYRLRNRFWLAYKYLPLPYKIFYLLGWSGQYSLKAMKSRRLGELFRAIKDGVLSTKHLKRLPLDKKAIAYLKTNFGRLWH